MIAAKFNRTEFAPDMYSMDRDSGLYSIYPEAKFGALAAWAWGYHRCVDALADMPYVDGMKIAVTGHSRGGKTALLAGATDERIAFINANASGTGGAACFRYHMVSDKPFDGVRESEPLHVTKEVVRNWYCDALWKYVGHEAELPFDQHFLEAMAAPRCLLQTEGMLDLWANPKGTLQTHLAVLELYRFLGSPENTGIHYHNGGHDQGMEDITALLDFMECRMNGKPLPEQLQQNPFPDMPPIYDKCPSA